MSLRIEIWCEGMDLHGEQLTDRVVVRVPSDILVIDSHACKEILERRRKRIKDVNKYRRNYNQQFDDRTELNIFGKKELKEKLYKIRIKGWTPIISRDALEFICERF